MTTQTCHFKIPDGRNIRFYIAEFKDERWKRCPRRRGCGKRLHHWAGPRGNDGRRANRWRAPCAYSSRSVAGGLADFYGA